MTLKRSLISAVSLLSLLSYDAYAVGNESLPLKPMTYENRPYALRLPYQPFQATVEQLRDAQVIPSEMRKKRLNEAGQFIGWQPEDINFFLVNSLHAERRLEELSLEIRNTYMPDKYKAVPPEAATSVELSYHTYEQNGFQRTSAKMAMDQLESYARDTLAHLEGDKISTLWFSSVFKVLAQEIKSYILREIKFQPEFKVGNVDATQGDWDPSEGFIKQQRTAPPLLMQSWLSSLRDAFASLGITLSNDNDMMNIQFIHTPFPPFDTLSSEQQNDKVSEAFVFDIFQRQIGEVLLDVTIDFQDFCAPLGVAPKKSGPLIFSALIHTFTPTIPVPNHQFRIPLPFGKKFVEAQQRLRNIELFADMNKKRNGGQMGVWLPNEKDFFQKLILKYTKLAHDAKMERNDHLPEPLRRPVTASTPGASSSSATSSTSSTSTSVAPSVQEDDSLLHRITSEYLSSEPSREAFQLTDFHPDEISLKDLPAFLDRHWEFDQDFRKELKNYLRLTMKQAQIVDDTARDHSQDEAKMEEHMRPFEDLYEAHILPGINRFLSQQDKDTTLEDFKARFAREVDAGLQVFMASFAGHNDFDQTLLKKLAPELAKKLEVPFKDIRRTYTTHHVEAVHAIIHYLSTLVTNACYAAAQPLIDWDLFEQFTIPGSAALKGVLVAEQRELRRTHKMKVFSSTNDFIAAINFLNSQKLGYISPNDKCDTHFSPKTPYPETDPRSTYKAYKATEEGHRWGAALTADPLFAEAIYRWEAYRTAVMGLANQRGILDWADIAIALETRHYFPKLPVRHPPFKQWRVELQDVPVLGATNSLSRVFMGNTRKGKNDFKRMARNVLKLLNWQREAQERVDAQRFQSGNLVYTKSSVNDRQVHIELGSTLNTILSADEGEMRSHLAKNTDQIGAYIVSLIWNTYLVLVKGMAYLANPQPAVMINPDDYLTYPLEALKKGCADLKQRELKAEKTIWKAVSNFLKNHNLSDIKDTDKLMKNITTRIVYAEARPQYTEGHNRLKDDIIGLMSKRVASSVNNLWNFTQTTTPGDKPCELDSSIEIKDKKTIATSLPGFGALFDVDIQKRAEALATLVETHFEVAYLEGLVESLKHVVVDSTLMASLDAHTLERIESLVENPAPSEPAKGSVNVPTKTQEKLTSVLRHLKDQHDSGTMNREDLFASLSSICQIATEALASTSTSTSSSTSSSTSTSTSTSSNTENKEKSTSSFKFATPSTEEQEDAKRARLEEARKQAAQKAEDDKRAEEAAEEARRQAALEAEAELKRQEEAARLEAERLAAELPERLRQQEENRLRAEARRETRKEAAKRAREEREKNRLLADELQKVEEQLEQEEKERWAATQASRRLKEEERLKAEEAQRDAERIARTVREREKGLAFAEQYHAEQARQREELKQQLREQYESQRKAAAEEALRQAARHEAARKADAEGLAKFKAERIKAERAEAYRIEVERIEAERRAEAIEAARLARIETKRRAEAVEVKRIAPIETERRAAAVEVEPIARVEAERRFAQAEAHRVEAERCFAQAEAHRVEAERCFAQAEAHRVEVERLEAARLAAIEAARLAEVEAARVESERLEAKRKAKEEADKIETQRLEAERKAKEEAQRLTEELAKRLANEERQRLEAQRKANKEAERVKAAKWEAAYERIRLAEARLQKSIADRKGGAIPKAASVGVEVKVQPASEIVASTPVTGHVDVELKTQPASEIIASNPATDRVDIGLKTPSQPEIVASTPVTEHVGAELKTQPAPKIVASNPATGHVDAELKTQPQPEIVASTSVTGHVGAELKTQPASEIIASNPATDRVDIGLKTPSQPEIVASTPVTDHVGVELRTQPAPEIAASSLVVADVSSSTTQSQEKTRVSKDKTKAKKTAAQRQKPAVRAIIQEFTPEESRARADYLYNLYFNGGRQPPIPSLREMNKSAVILYPENPVDFGKLGENRNAASGRTVDHK